MRKALAGIGIATGLLLSGCVETRQYADVQFTPPQGDYKLLVLRPDISVGSITTGGIVEPRADWTEQARASVTAALQAQQAARGGQVLFIQKRTELPTVSAEELADVERLNMAVAQSIVLHKYLGEYLPTKRGRGLDWTLGEDAVRLGQKSGYDYALFFHAEDQVASTGRIALGVLGVAGCFVGFCAPNIGGATEISYASLVDLKTGQVVWFNVVRSSSQVPGLDFGDLRSREGADKLIDRLLGRMRPGQAVRAAAAAGETN